MTQRRPVIVGIGGTTDTSSSTERALEIALRAAAGQGAEIEMFGGAFLSRLPLYAKNAARSSEEQILIEAVRRADGMIIASPGYHGSVSGLMKNALDLLEETAADPRVYLTGMPVGVIATAYGWQATGGTIAALRGIVHALRGWPTPLASAVNSSVSRFADDGACTDPAAVAQLGMVGQQVVEFLRRPALA